MNPAIVQYRELVDTLRLARNELTAALTREAIYVDQGAAVSPSKHKAAQNTRDRITALLEKLGEQ